MNLRYALLGGIKNAWENLARLREEGRPESCPPATPSSCPCNLRRRLLQTRQSTRALFFRSITSLADQKFRQISANSLSIRMADSKYFFVDFECATVQFVGLIVLSLLWQRQE